MEEEFTRRVTEDAKKNQCFKVPTSTEHHHKCHKNTGHRH